MGRARAWRVGGRANPHVFDHATVRRKDPESPDRAGAGRVAPLLCPGVSKHAVCRLGRAWLSPGEKDLVIQGVTPGELLCVCGSCRRPECTILQQPCRTFQHQEILIND